MPTPRTGHAFLDAQRTAPRSVLAFAHRGGAYHPEIEGLENTLAAFQHAVGLGYRYLETDVHVTADGVLLAFHDEMLDRVTDRTGSLAAMTLQEVRRARVGGHEQIPTLVELLDQFPTVRFNIDLKADRAVEALAGLIRNRRAWDRVLVGSFSARRTVRFRRLTRGRVATAAHPAEVLGYRLSPTAALARTASLGRPAALQIPHRATRVAPVTVCTRGLVERAHAAGLHVHVWTVDDPDEMHQLLDRGVDGIVTDRTDLLREVLVDRGQWYAGEADG